jgi:hypothetical protein
LRLKALAAQILDLQESRPQNLEMNRTFEGLGARVLFRLYDEQDDVVADWFGGGAGFWIAGDSPEALDFSPSPWAAVPFDC